MRDSCVQVFPVEAAPAGVRVEVTTDWPTVLADVLERPGGLRPHFQPIIDLRRGVVAGYEAVARFPAAPGVSPVEVFAAAVRHGVAGRLEARVVDQVLAARRHVAPDCFLSLNVSPLALLEPAVQRAFAAAGRLDAVVVEVSEQRGAEVDALLAVLSDLQGRGALVAVDDAGCGYDSLGRIAALRPQFVKIDRDLVAHMDSDPAKAAAVQTLGDLAARMHAWVIAEGVERVEEVDALVRMRVPLGQGFAFGRPGPGLAEVLDDGLAERVRRRPRADAAPGTVAACVEAAPVAAGPDTTAALAALFAPCPAPDVAVVVDAAGRPAGLVHGADVVLGDLAPRPVLCVAATDAASDAARRAMMRPLAQRFDPLVLCDGEGVVVGLVRVERIVELLAV